MVRRESTWRVAADKQFMKSKRNKFVISRYLPLRPYVALNFFGLIVVRKENLPYYDSDLKVHERIHTVQMIETLFVGFYLWYFAEWLVRLVVTLLRRRAISAAYTSILFEKEAYLNQSNPSYLSARKPFQYSWLRRS